MNQNSDRHMEGSILISGHRYMIFSSLRITKLCYIDQNNESNILAISYATGHPPSYPGARILWLFLPATQPLKLNIAFQRTYSD